LGRGTEREKKRQKIKLEGTQRGREFVLGNGRKGSEEVSQTGKRKSFPVPRLRRNRSKNIRSSERKKAEEKYVLPIEEKHGGENRGPIGPAGEKPSIGCKRQAKGSGVVRNGQ